MTTNEFTTASGNYLIKSYGNGWAYEIVSNHSLDSLWFQDSDAETIRTESNDFENEAVIKMYFENLC